VTGMIRRGMRLELVAAVSIAMAMPAVALATQAAATQTTLAVETRDQAGRTTATAAVSVAGEDGLPASGAVAISDRGQQVAGAALNKQGQATVILGLPAGDHSLTATYMGSATHSSSVSSSASVTAQDSTTPGFAVSVAPATLSLTPGTSGTVAASVTPQNSSALTAPMFVTLSCSGLPDQSSCTFTPENIEILPNATAAYTSSMVVQTQQQEGFLARPRPNGIALAILLPGMLGLGGLAFAVRRRAWLQRLSLLALVALVASLGTTACNARYDYYNHGPPINPATPAGTYTVKVIAQSSNGVTATTNFATLAFTVQ